MTFDFLEDYHCKDSFSSSDLSRRIEMEMKMEVELMMRQYYEMQEIHFCFSLAVTLAVDPIPFPSFYLPQNFS